jgi:RNA polymerase sigma-70 factor (ECF subfamily)
MSPRQHLRLVTAEQSSSARGLPELHRSGLDAEAEATVDADPISEAQPAVLDETPSLPAATTRSRELGRPSSKSMAELSDGALVALVVEGERGAAEALYRRHAPFALNLAARIAGSSAEIEDVVHDSFLRAFEGLAGLRNAAAFRTWLGSIVVHSMRSRLRREKLRRVLGLSWGRGTQTVDIESIASSSASPVMRAELAQVYALLGTLSTDDRIAWTLRYVEGHDLNEAAALAGCSLATIKRRILRAERFIDQHFVATGSDSSKDRDDEEESR